MKTFKIKREFLVSRNLLGALLLSPFLFVLPKSVLQMSNAEVNHFKNDSSIFLSSARNVQTEAGESASAENSSGFLKFLAKIGGFFVVVGSGIGKGITSALQFLGKVIASPFTATYSFFARNSEVKAGTSGEQSRNNV